MAPNRVQVFAIVRIDKYLRVDQEETITVQAVLPSLAEAKAEVARLNAMRDPEQIVYFWRATRFYPDGRHGEDRAGAVQ